jgi:hypothetical protein
MAALPRPRLVHVARQPTLDLPERVTFAVTAITASPREWSAGALGRRRPGGGIGSDHRMDLVNPPSTS